MKNERDDASNPDLAEIRSALRDEFKPMFPELSAPASMSAEPEQRMETTSEHIARDIREGRFPQRSEPQMVSMSAENRPAQDDVRDAQRYRWLREQNANSDSGWAVVEGEDFECWDSCWVGEELDEAIDAAIASQSAIDQRCQK